MANQIFRNGPPTWVLDERRRQAAEQAIKQSRQPGSKPESNGEHTPNSESGGKASHSRSTSTKAEEPIRKPQKPASIVS